MAVLSAIVGFCHTMVGFTNHQLVERVNALLDDVTYASRQATYDLRRLIRKGVITRIPHTHRYHVTATKSPTPDHITPCSSPEPTTGCCVLAWPNSPIPSPPRCAPPATTTRSQSTTSPNNPAWHHRT